MLVNEIESNYSNGLVPKRPFSTISYNSRPSPLSGSLLDRLIHHLVCSVFLSSYTSMIQDAVLKAVGLEFKDHKRANLGSNTNDCLQVIGAGLPRCGTTSLKAALETLGFDPCHHMVVCSPLSDPDLCSSSANILFCRGLRSPGSIDRRLSTTQSWNRCFIKP